MTPKEIARLARLMRKYCLTSLTVDGAALEMSPAGFASTEVHETALPPEREPTAEELLFHSAPTEPA